MKKNKETKETSTEWERRSAMHIDKGPMSRIDAKLLPIMKKIQRQTVQLKSQQKPWTEEIKMGNLWMGNEKLSHAIRLAKCEIWQDQVT